MAEMTEKQLHAEIEEHAKVHERVTKEVDYWLEVNERDCKNGSPRAAFSRGIHAVFHIYQIDLATMINYEIGRIQPMEIWVIYKGRKAIRIFIDIINMFEGQLNTLAEISEPFQQQIDLKVKPLIDSVEQNWNQEVKKIKDGVTKEQLIKNLEARKLESSMRRRALLNLGWISKDDYDLLEFSWWLRNCMHNDFSALTDKQFSFEDVESEEMFGFDLKKGKAIVMHTSAIYSLSRIIGRILYNIIEQGHPADLN